MKPLEDQNGGTNSRVCQKQKDAEVLSQVCGSFFFRFVLIKNKCFEKSYGLKHCWMQST